MPDQGELGRWLERIEAMHPRVVDLGLERIDRVLRRLALSQPDFRVITVAGTNGKGSTVAMLECLLAGNHHAVGTLTSPHLWRFNERVRIDAEPVADSDLIDWFEAIEAARDSAALTFFEFTTAAALLGFHARGVKIAVLEVGLGGRLDAVNAIDPDVAVITSIALDHQAWLGETREDIGREKAGIMRADRPCVIGDPRPPESVIERARALSARVYRYGHDFTVRPGAGGLDYCGLSTNLHALPETTITANANGQNLACALAALECLGGDLLADTASVAAALAELRVPGRFQRHETAGVEWILDVAHNPAAAANLARQLASLPRRPTTALIGMMKDKDGAGVAAALRDVIDRWVAVPIARPSGRDAASLAAQLRTGGATRIAEAESVAVACLDLAGAAGAGERIVVLGSFYVVAPAGEVLGIYSAAPHEGDEPARPDGVAR